MRLLTKALTLLSLAVFLTIISANSAEANPSAAPLAQSNQFSTRITELNTITHSLSYQRWRSQYQTLKVTEQYDWMDWPPTYAPLHTS